MATDYRQIFQPVFNELGFKTTKTFRAGPRFYVLGGEYRGEKVIFKADVEPLHEVRSTKAQLKLRREAAFLETGDLEHIPRFYAKGTHRAIEREFFWLLEEWVPGESQEQGESTFLIKDSFFTSQNLKYVLEFLTILRDLPKANGSSEFTVFKEKFARRYTLKDYTALITSDKEELVGEERMDKIDDFIDERGGLFDANQTVITHHEFYGPHIFVNGGELNVIDWENVGWGNPAYDFTELWIRSFAHSDFQAELQDHFRSVQEDTKVFDQLFSLEILLQGVGNLRHFKVTEVPEEKAVAEKVISFLSENISRVLG